MPAGDPSRFFSNSSSDLQATFRLHWHDDPREVRRGDQRPEAQPLGFVDVTGTQHLASGKDPMDVMQRLSDIVNRKRNREEQSGFTLIELLVVIVILGILSAV